MIAAREVTGVDGMRYRVLERTFADGRRRTASIQGPIRSHGLKRRGVSGVHDRTPFDHRGHLIAHRFGGPSGRNSGNLVPMHGLINMAGGPWSKMEWEIADILGEQQGQMRVFVFYQGDDVRPDAFVVRVNIGGQESRFWRSHNYNPYLPELLLPDRD